MTTTDQHQRIYRTPVLPLSLAGPIAIILSTLLLCSPLVFANGQQFQSIDAIKRAAEQFINQHTNNKTADKRQVTIGNIDSRLTLASCNTPLDAFLPPGAKTQGKTTVGIRCQHPKPWTLYVPATVTTFTEILVASSPLRRGHIINAGDILVETRDASRLNGAYLTNEENAVGKILKKNLANKALFTRSILSEPHIVQKGQQIELLAGEQGLKVSASAVALSGGAVGQKIRVRNLSSNKIIEGIILPSGAIKAD